MTEVARDCLVCRKHRGEGPMPGGPIYQDEMLVVSHVVGGEPERTYLGYLMIEPRRHVASLADLTDEEAQDLGLMMARASRVLKQTGGADHVYVFVLGHHVPHLHVHLVARYPGAPREYWGVHVDEWPEAPRGGEPEIAAVVARLRSALAAARPETS